MVPIFTTHHSIGHAILTLDSDIYKKINERQPDGKFLQKKTEEVEMKEPISIFAIAKKHDEKVLTLIESDISSYWKFYKTAKEHEVQPVYGIKLTVCEDMEDKSPEAIKTESDIIILLNTTEAYYKIVPLYSVASTTGMTNRRRVDWRTLQKLWSDDFSLLIPFYSSFIARNLMVHDHTALPNFGAIEPTFLIQNQGMPFDGMIHEATTRFAQGNGLPTEDVHQVYYYKDADVMKHLTVQCIHNRRYGQLGSWEKPNLEHYGSNEFSYESYLRKIGKTL